MRRCRAGRATGFRESMALIGVLSTQVWHETFCTGAMHFPEETVEPRVRLELDLPVRVGSAA